MKRLLIILMVLTLLPAGMEAQRRGKRFDPKRFQMELEQYITEKAALSPKQASAFFPLYREMQRRQRNIFCQMKMFRYVNTDDDKASKRAITEMDKLDIEMKDLQQSYHRKFMKVIPAGTLMKVIRAEDAFHRQAFRRAMRHRPAHR